MAKHFKNLKNSFYPYYKKRAGGGKDIVNEKTGEIKTIHIGSRRLKNIYKTNSRVTYNKQRYENQMLLKDEVYFKYRSALLENSRDEHSAKHGIILHRDNPFWDRNYPPNDWGCKCKVSAHSKKEIDQKKWTIDKSSNSIAGKDWDYHVGKTDALSQLKKMNIDEKLNSLPLLRKNQDYANMTEDALLAKFYKNMGVKKGDIFIDKVGDPMVIDDTMFKNANSSIKIKKRDRHLVLDYFATTIKTPDEIYLEVVPEENNRLIKRFSNTITIMARKQQ
jgi:hypothetical protein